MRAPLIAAIAAVVAAAGVVTCQIVFTTNSPSAGNTAPAAALQPSISPPALSGRTARSIQLTADYPNPGYTVVRKQGPLLQVANTGSGGNQREILLDPRSPVESSSRACSQWVSGKGFTQDGLAFRTTAAKGGWNSVVLERNIWNKAFSAYVIIYFHTGAGYATQYDVGPHVDLSAYLGPTNVFPLSICASIRNNTLTFSVAKGDDPMPPLGTKGRGGTLTLDSSKVPATGRTGIYVAHVPPGQVAAIDRITIDGKAADLP